MIVQALHEIQKTHGFLPKSELKAFSERTGTPLYRLQEVASFFPHFRLEPPPGVEVQVCRDMACHLRGAAALQQDLSKLCSGHGGEGVHVGGVSCLGRCDNSPVVCINEQIYAGHSARELSGVVRKSLAGDQPAGDRDADLTSAPATPWRIDPYEGNPVYAAVRKFIKDQDPDRILKELETADLRGMGGAGVWAYRKWSDVRHADGDEKYVVCNADESEPGTFKDREILLRAPHLVVEGVILAGLLVNAKKGYIYIRHEYQEEIEAVEKAIRRAETLGACGKRITDTQRSFPVEVFVSPGGYICGEQSALLEAMEDRRAEPRNKPPLLETNGLYDKPTIVNNVETLAWVPVIVLGGGEHYRDQALNGCKGLRFFSICGDVQKPGVCEVPNGISLRELIFDHAGGMRENRPLKAFAPSGPSGGFLPARIPVELFPRGFEKRLPAPFARQKLAPGTTHLDVLDLLLDLQFFRDLGLMLGAGLVIYNDQADMVDQALNCLEFFRNESCGKCVPCRIGSQKLVEIGTDLQRARLDLLQLQNRASLVKELARTMAMTSICGLGTVAANPLTALLQHFPDDVEKYLSKAAGRARNGETGGEGS
jgi:NADH:ubiquinone oxidoreductase subunit F (NADH-binding)/NADH:ubiquinone oxidoreductase subunit E